LLNIVYNKRHLKSISTNEELTTITFNNDGFTIAVGTRNGKILVFDLRNTYTSKIQLLGHDNKQINSLEFSKKILNINNTNNVNLSRASEMSSNNLIPNSNPSASLPINRINFNIYTN